jgi:TRAP-type uncharacterized transport system substrate-binding protein
LIVRADVKSLAELNGKRVDLPIQAPATHEAIERALSAAGAKPVFVRTEDTLAARLKALSAEEVDATAILLDSAPTAKELARVPPSFKTFQVRIGRR